MEHPGTEPAIVLMHGFPDNLHLYDRVVPQLAGRRVVAFDFLGWGRSDKPPGYPHTATNQVGEVEAVMDGLALEQAVLVAHDASGPPAIDWAVAHPERVSGLVLLNTYYGWHPALRAPEAIALYSTPLVRTIARAVVRRNERLDEKLFAWQVGRFIRDEAARAELVPRLYADFRAARPAFWRLNDDLLGTVISRRLRSRRLRHFDRPVRIVFGDADPYLNRRVAWRLHRLLPTSDLHLLATARHYVQVDEPGRVAELIASIGAR
ncbi:alpha/beta hydrolase [Pseudonocardia sp. DSM 110487]|uniref:alpha/beta fold hydrolase n=1 Tax=Pseudonocardia sp. DSM 110487 TaxID=2865833 RepID=UPI001C69479A|nr:alpha/beta hydrolase [Pseudonocardia sp. DSM 110487]QYN37292.1 alpha/beta hydrolase [Pseudonocardia sp. DSM 110487]